MEERDEIYEAIITSQGELVGSISHELKGLLNGIDGGVYLLESGVKKSKPERIDQGLEMVYRNLTRMRRLVSHSLYFVKDREIDWESLDLEEVCASVIKMFQQQADHLGVKLVLDSQSRPFEGGVLPIQSLLANLLEYALEASHLAKAKPSPSITLSAALADGRVEFEILSDGFTMEEETRERVMGRYYAPRGTDRSHLSLFLANKIVTSHGGTLEIVSSDDKLSTRFLVKLPAANPGGSPGEAA
jgi:signal transduction histidine kinase